MAQRRQRAMRMLLAIAGVAILAIGVRLSVRMRRWSPRISPDFSDYDPGPDAIDWARAVAPILVGAALLLLALGS